MHFAITIFMYGINNNNYFRGNSVNFNVERMYLKSILLYICSR